MLPATHFQVFGDISGVQAMELFLPTCLLMLGNQIDVSEVLLREEREGCDAGDVCGWIIGTVILETMIVAIAVVGSALYPDGRGA